jgi:hypothetical protein
MSRKKYHQTGKSDYQLDFELSAKKPGKRKSKKGKEYWEFRKNRSDMPNKKI